MFIFLLTEDAEVIIPGCVFVTPEWATSLALPLEAKIAVITSRKPQLWGFIGGLSARLQSYGQFTMFTWWPLPLNKV